MLFDLLLQLLDLQFEFGNGLLVVFVSSSMLPILRGPLNCFISPLVPASYEF